MGADPEAGGFRRFARRSGLTHYENWGVPEATQLLRHGFVQLVPELGLGRLPGGLGDGWLAHASFSSQSPTGIEEHRFTVVISRVPESVGFAVRVTCHDRGLSAEERSNPSADAEVIELSDRDVAVESVRFLERYCVVTDNDQDPLRSWQLFSPALIDWLTDKAPARFSFELQDGALCCFVPEYLTAEAELAELCAAADRVNDRVRELGAAAPSTAATARTRAAIIEAELAAHPFASPPASVWAAAREFGWWGLVTGRSWRLGAEAFFRAYAAGQGFTRIDDARFRAGAHLTTPMPGEITQIAAGRLDRGAGPPAWLVLTKDEAAGSGWMALVVDPPNRDRLYAFVGLPETAAAEQDGFQIAADDRSLIVFKPDRGARARSKRVLDEFLRTAREVARASIAAAGPG